jgi:hypothetical protein
MSDEKDYAWVNMQKCDWGWHEDDDAFCLQIELGNKHAVTLTIWKNGDPNGVSIWYGNSSHGFTKDGGWYGETLDSFKAWVTEAAQKAA